MGERGPKPLTSAELKARGSWRWKPRADDERRDRGVMTALVKAPDGMNERHRQVWDALVATMEPAGPAIHVERRRPAMAGFTALFCSYMEIREGEEFADLIGEPVRGPMFSLAHEAGLPDSDAWDAFCDRLGLKAADAD